MMNIVVSILESKRHIKLVYISKVNTKKFQETNEFIMIKKIQLLVLFISISLCTFSQTGKPKPDSATGFIYVKQIDGVWWFIGPEGEKFVSIGANHIEPHLWLAPYNKEATLKKYGSDYVGEEGLFNTNGEAAKKWIDQQVKTYRDLHFNTFGRHTHPSIDTKLYEDQVYYITSLQTGPLAGWRERNGEGPRRMFSQLTSTILSKNV